MNTTQYVSVAQLDRVTASDAVGSGFDSRRAHQIGGQDHDPARLFGVSTSVEANRRPQSADKGASCALSARRGIGYIRESMRPRPRGGKCTICNPSARFGSIGKTVEESGGLRSGSESFFEKTEVFSKNTRRAQESEY